VSDDAATESPKSSLASLAGRGAIGGTLMGLANLVPGISGGTMLLAAGVYPKFISAVAEVSTLKFRKESLVILASVVCAAGVAIVLLAGPVKDLVVNQRWMAYSVFIGLTLGGVPLVRRLIRKFTPSVIASAVVGLVVMVAIALAQASSSGTAGASTAGFGLMLLAGIAGASAMILPGISGGYLLLVLGVYVTILSAVDAVKVALKAGDVGLMMTPMLEVVLPVGIGVVLGVVVVSNALRWLLARFEQPTLGVLLGLLVGAVAGLWPFQRGVAPNVGDTFKGQTVTPKMLAELKPEDFPTEFFDPSGGQMAGALGLVVLGLFITYLVSRVGGRAPPSDA
jgi:putative membrane protein